MSKKIIKSVFVAALIFVPQLIAASEPNINILQWEIIAGKFSAKESFCCIKAKDANSINYAFDANVSIVTLPSKVKMAKEKTEIELNLSKWQKGQWVDSIPLSARIDPNGLIIDINKVTEGFYKLSAISDKNDVGIKNNYYWIIDANWKNDLFSWCKKAKEQVETNPDSQLIYSSIVVSHLDNVMELTGKSQILSETILKALSNAIKAKASFEDGNCPDLAIGVNKIRLKRFEGASIAEFVLKLPIAYSNSKKWPMLVYADPRRVGARDNNYYKESSEIIVLWWHFPMPAGYEWKDYQLFLDIISNKINLDKDRIYVNGECGNGISAVDLGLKYPDQWAECSASLGNASRQLAGNAMNLPLIFVKGGHNEDWAIGYYDFAVECFKYYGCRYFKHSRDQSTNGIRGKSIPDIVRNISPQRVSFTIESLSNSQSYWVQINGREDENFIGSIDAIVWGQSILVKTNNVDAYKLNLKQAPLDCNRPVEIIENNKFLETVIGPAFARNASKYENALYIKSKFLNGPVSDIFTEQYAVVWKGDENIKKLAGQLAGSAPCFEDANLPAEFINTHNIIFVGKLNESQHFAQIAGKLPVKVANGKLTANDKIYEGDTGAIFIYPNPLNLQKYIAVFSGTTNQALGLLSSAWSQIKSKENADVAIYQVVEENQLKWLICEKFNTIWDWYKSWDEPLATISEDYPKWKWRQWIARALKEQLKADVMISEDPFESAELPAIGELTLRDLSRIFKNDWIVKISIKGSDLRELLMVPFNDISSREVSAPVIEGMSLVKQSANSDIMCINDLEPNKFYTVAFPYKAVNGKRLGMVMKDYRLESEGFLVGLLKAYLAKNRYINLNDELKGMQLNIF